MNSVCRELFRAIHEGLWVSIEYKNQDEKITKYWIGIKRLDPKRKSLVVDGLHLANFSLRELTIYIGSILSAVTIKGSYCPVNEWLVKDISLHPQRYSEFFGSVINLKILNYLSDCNKMDTTPYMTDYALLKNLDEDRLVDGRYALSNEQFQEIVKTFQYESKSESAQLKIKQLCMNVLSINTPKGLYVLAHRRLSLDVQSRTLVADDAVTINQEYTIEGEKQSIRFFLDADDFVLLDDFETNRELIKDRLMKLNRRIGSVDDLPHLIAIGYDVVLDLNSEYAAISDMYSGGNSPTKPIEAFFGNLLERPIRRKEYPIVLCNKKANLDQLLAISTALKYPLTYVQGPPGTGKTNTIVNTILSAFFNERTVLFASYNNHPIDGVFDALTGLMYHGNAIPFPVIRLGNNDKVAEALDYIRVLYEKTKNINVYLTTLTKYKEEQIERTKKLTVLLKKHEEILDLTERKATIEKVLSATKNFSFTIELQARQLNEIEEKLKSIDTVTNQDALDLMPDDLDELYKYLYYVSAKHIKRLSEQKYDRLREIIYTDDTEKKVAAFNRYLSDEDNVEQFLRIFPVVITTCISAHKIGKPRQYFDMVIMDEASQCNTAISLVPILRGDNLMLVGDPQQLKPVVLLDSLVNHKLRKKYAITDEYDYISNSVYQTFVAADAVSDEILLSHHYRCHPKIIEFNNRKFYNKKLLVESSSKEEEPLVFVNIRENETDYKNTSPAECDEIVKYAKLHTDQKIGVITPFVNQKNLINEELKKYGCQNVSCGTVHSFQGDEKDVILFSLALTKQTGQKTYDWLKNNKELINVAVSRAKDKFVLLVSEEDLSRLHTQNDRDDIYELAEYVRTNGKSHVTGLQVSSRALGVKPYSTETEDAFLISLNHALDNIAVQHRQCVVHKEVAVSQVFQDDFSHHDLFYTGRFDFVVFDKRTKKPLLAIELDGKEHYDDDTVKARDRQKEEICRQHNFQLIRVENSYARRYTYIKNILTEYFSKI